MKKGKIIAGSVLSIIMCSSLIAGATMALFTSESTTNIAVTSGNVDVQATASITGGSSWNASKEGVEGAKKFDFTTKEDKQYSAYYLNEDATTTTDNDGKITNVTFKNQGSAYIGKDDSNEDALILNNITPGDAVKLGITIENNSNVAVNYRIKFYCDNEYKADDTENKTTLTDYTLFDSLKISIPVSSSTKYTKASLSGVKSYTTAWMYLDASKTTGIENVEATIELPITIGNDAMNRTCKIKYVVEAVQGNAALNDDEIDVEYIDGKSGSATIATVSQDETVTATQVVVQNAITNQQATTSATQSTQNVTVSVPKTATGTANNVIVNVKETTKGDIQNSLSTPNNTVTLSTKDGSTVYAFDVSAYADGEKTSAVTNTNSYYQISFVIGSGLALDTIYHKDVALTTTENESGEYYVYSGDTITIYTKSLSPFVVSYRYSGGKGTSTSPYLISTVDQLQNLENGYVSGGCAYYKYYNLVNDITVENKDILVVTDSYGSHNCVIAKSIKYVNIDGKNNIIDLNNEEAFFIYDAFTRVALKDFTMKNIKKPIVQNAGYETTFSNVDVVNSNMYLSNNQGVYVQYANPNATNSATSYSYSYLTFTGCDVGRDVVLNGAGGYYSYNAVFVGYLYNDNYSTKINDISFTNCTFSGTYTSGQASMFIGNYNCKNLNLTVTNCANYGTIRVVYTEAGKVYSDNEFFGEGLYDYKKLTFVLDNVTYLIDGDTNKDVSAIKNLSVTKEGGKFIYGPLDNSLKLTQNTDGTYTITPAESESVTYYEVSYTIYTKLKVGGTLVQTVIEKINVTTGEVSFKSTLKNLQFVDQEWLNNHTTFTKSAEASFNGFYIVSDGTTSYYLINNEEKCTLKGIACGADAVGVTAYDANGNIIAAASLEK